MYQNILVPQQLLCSVVMQNIQIFKGGPFMFVVTCFCYLSFIMFKVVLSRTELIKCIPNILMYNCDRTICPSLSVLFLCTTVHKTWIFQSFVFELEAFSCDFKIDCILVWHLMPLNKKMVLPSEKFNIFISCSSICTPLIFVSASMEIASAS